MQINLNSYTTVLQIEVLQIEVLQIEVLQIEVLQIQQKKTFFLKRLFVYVFASAVSKKL